MKERRYLYEGMYVLNANLSEDGRKKALDKITGGITEKKGEVHKLLDWGRRRLAYEINKKREGYYYIVYFTIGSSQIKELWKEYHLHEDLLRYLTRREDTVKESIEFKPFRLS